MKDYLSFDGNDNPEFPKAIGKGDKVARENTPEQEDEIAKNYAGLENLDYDIEPDEKFKERLKKAIEGHTTMGNAPTTEKTDVKPSNGSRLGEEPKDKDGNVIPTPEHVSKLLFVSAGLPTTTAILGVSSAVVEGFNSPN